MSVRCLPQFESRSTVRTSHLAEWVRPRKCEDRDNIGGVVPSDGVFALTLE